MSLVNTKNTANGAIGLRFHCFQDGATMVWVYTQTNKKKPTCYTDKHPIWRKETTWKIPLVTKKNALPLLPTEKWVIIKSIRN
jgi:hypothetical protein